MLATLCVIPSLLAPGPERVAQIFWLKVGLLYLKPRVQYRTLPKLNYVCLQSGARDVSVSSGSWA